MAAKLDFTAVIESAVALSYRHACAAKFARQGSAVSGGASQPVTVKVAIAAKAKSQN